jgi:hypothetical protein
MAIETANERVRLLKNGISGKRIEQLYIEYNNFSIVDMSKHALTQLTVLEITP